MNYQEVDGYTQAKAEYDGAITAARAAKDELAEMKAEIAWRDRVDGFKDQAAQAVAKANAIEAAKAKAKADFPHAPEAVYSGLSDPEAILAAAGQAHTAIAAAMPTQPPAGQQWTTPPSGGSAPPPPAHKFDDPTEWNKSMEQLRSMPKNSTGAFDSPQAKAQRDYVVDKLWGKQLRDAQ